ncbi:uncharacterized protein LOC135140143 [Zophobas morio]|uniref:uncharacterized protein LOC135140143 n=1 Tax=Zophobas morio TaxID=2755281 RepID=UPI003083458C
MALHLLTLFFKVGYILPITPPLSSRPSILRKIYCILIFVILTTGAFFTIQSRNFYRNTFFMKQFFLYANDLIVLALIFHVIVVYNFWQNQQWKKFLARLEVSKKMTDFGQSRRYLSKIPCWTCFVAGHVVFTLIASYGIVIWFQIEGLLVLKRITVSTAEYINFFYLLLLCHLVYMLLKQYRGVNKTLVAYATQRQGFPDDVARVTGYVICYLKETTDMFNTLFGWPVFLIIFHTVLLLLIYVFVMVTQDESYEALSLHICITAFTMFMTSLYLVMCDKVSQESQKTVSLTYKLRWSWQQVSHSQKQELYEFTNLVVLNSPVFTAAGFFRTGKFTIIEILATVSSTLVILLQFNNK